MFGIFLQVVVYNKILPVIWEWWVFSFCTSKDPLSNVESHIYKVTNYSSAAGAARAPGQSKATTAARRAAAAFYFAKSR